MTTEPYRGSHVREGVALPRRGLGAWAAAIAIAWFLAAAIGAFLHFRLPWHPPLLVPVALGAGVLVSSRAYQLSRGRSTRPATALAVALSPAFLGELLVSSYGLWMGPFLRDPTLLPVWQAARQAEVHVWSYAVTALACAMTAVGCTAHVLTVDTRRLAPSTRRSLPLYLSGLAVMASVGLDIMRVRDTHRDGLGGALAAVAIVATAVLAPFLVGRADRMTSWHDAVEARSVRRAGICAVVALTFAGMACDRAALAYDEHLLLGSLSTDLPFDARLDAAHALTTAYHAHGTAIAIVAIAGLLGTVSFAFVRLPRDASSDAAALAIMVAAHVIILTEAWARDRSSLMRPIEMTTQALPSAPGLQRALLPPFDADPLVVDPSRPSSETVGVVQESGEPVVLLVEGARRIEGLDRRPAALLGPRTFGLRFSAKPAVEPDDSDLYVLDDGQVARVKTARSPVRGISLRRDSEAREKRALLAPQFHDAVRIFLARDPRGDTQALVDAMVAASDLSPRADLVVVTDRDAVERIVTGRSGISP